MPADSNRAALRFWEETTFGAFATGTPKFTALRFTGESLRQETQTTVSQEIRSDRQVTDLVRTGVTAAGDLNFELSYGAYDDFLESALLSAAWSTQQQATGTTFSVTAGSGTYTIADSGSGFGSFAVGQWVYISGFSDAGNNGFGKITAASAGSITVKGNGNGVTDTAGDSVTITMGPQIVNGTTFKSYNMEREYTDVANEFEQLAGMAIDQLNLNTQADGLVNGSFGFVGKSAQSNTATLGDGSPTAAATNDVMNAIDDVQAVLENYTSYDVTQLSMSLVNNLRARLQVGTLGAVSLGTGTVGLTGGHQAYFESKAVMDKYLNATSSALSFIFSKGTNAYVVDMPRIKYSSGQRVAGGINQDILADMQWTAIRDATEDATIRIARFAGVIV